MIDMDYIRSLVNHRKPFTFTLESGHGQTYHTDKPTLYGHSVYEQSSVLAGQPLRRFLNQWESWDEARKELDVVKEKVAGFDYEDWGDGGTSHIDVDRLTSHLPNEEDS